MNQMKELDIRELLMACVYRAWLIVLCAVVGAFAAFLYTDNFVTPMYRAEVSFYVNNSSSDSGPNHSISSSDLATSQRLVLTYVNIIKSETVLDQVVMKSGLDVTVPQLRSSMTAASIDETELFKVYVTHADAQTAADWANAIADYAPMELEMVMVGSKASVLDRAKIPGAPYTPNTSRNITVGALVGLLLAVAVIIIRTLMDVRIKCEEDLSCVPDVVILGSIPDFTAPAAEPYSFRKNDAETGRR